VGTRDRRVDAYIAKSAPFARPILTRVREIVHATCPDVEETIKWGFPTFLYHGMLCGMAAFQQHASLGFWKSKLVLDGKGRPADESMGQFGRMTKASDLPPRATLAGYIRTAMKLNEQGISVPRRKPATPRPAPRTPRDLAAALAKNARARAAFQAFPPSHKREYVEWLLEAKRVETRRARLATAVAWIAAGKARNWKYEKRPGKAR
jgi:uncharacterized protein YdeI (YjbR/CyaY-like superfamily)